MAAFRKKEQAARDAHEAITLLRFALPEEIDRALAKREANGGSRPAKAGDGTTPLIEDGVARMQAERARDPDVYVMSMPRVRRALEAAAPDNSEATRAAVALRLDAQREMGMPEDQFRVLTRAEAGALASELGSAQGDEKVARIKDLQDLYGPNFDGAMKELVNNAGLDPRYIALAEFRDSPAVARIAAGAIDSDRAALEKDIDPEAVARIRSQAADATTAAAGDGAGDLKTRALAAAAGDIGTVFYRQTGNEAESADRAVNVVQEAAAETTPTDGSNALSTSDGNDTATGDVDSGTANSAADLKRKSLEEPSGGASKLQDAANERDPLDGGGGEDEFGRNTILEQAGFTFVKSAGPGKEGRQWVDRNGEPAQPGQLRKIVTDAIRKRAEKEGWSASRILTELHAARNGLPFDDRNNIEVACWFLPFLFATGEGAAIGTSLAEGLSAFLAALGLTGVLSLSGDTPQEKADKKDDDEELITVYRIEGSPNTRIMIDQTGGVTILGPDKKMLILNFGQRDRAIAYFKTKLSQGLPEAVIKSFKVPKAFADQIRQSAIKEQDAREVDPKKLHPRSVDENVAKDQFGIANIWIEELRRQIIQGTGKVETPEDSGIK